MKGGAMERLITFLYANVNYIVAAVFTVAGCVLTFGAVKEWIILAIPAGFCFSVPAAMLVIGVKPIGNGSSFH